MGRNRPGKRNYHRVPKRRRKRFYRPHAHQLKRPPAPPAPLVPPVFSDVETSVFCGLVRRGARVMMDHELDNDFKIDGVVYRVKRGPLASVPIGVQITQSVGNMDKIHKFVREAAKCPGIGQLLYAEIVGPISREMLTALREALLALWYDPERLRRRIWRVTVYHNGYIDWHPL